MRRVYICKKLSHYWEPKKKRCFSGVFEGLTLSKFSLPQSHKLSFLRFTFSLVLYTESLRKYLLFNSPKAGCSHWTDVGVIFRKYYSNATSIGFHGHEVEILLHVSSLRT